MRTIALRFGNLPQSCRGADLSTQSAEMQRCRVAHNLPPYLPSGLIRMRIEQIRESPLGLNPRAAELLYPFPHGRATDGSAVCLFTRWFTAA